MEALEFRAYDRDEEFGNSKMFYSTEHGLAIFFETWQNEPELITQYTGINDKNGKKIFEGDIVRYSIDGHMQTTPYHIKDMIEWIKEMNNPDEYYRWDDGIEVIGNRFENPELVCG